MGTAFDDQRRRVLLPHALGADQFLRVTWHDGRRVMVFSHWDGDTCIAATPVRVDDLDELAELVVAAFARSTASRRPWDPPRPGSCVSTAPPTRRTA